MNKSYALLLSFLCSLTCILCKAQTQDLYELVSGEMIHGSYLYDGHENMWGYIFITDEGESEDNFHEFEYVVLDKNLNKIASNSFMQSMSDRMKPAFTSITKHGDSIVMHAYLTYYSNSASSWLPKVNSLRIIDLNTNSAGKEYTIKGSKLIENKKNPNQLLFGNMDLFQMGTLDYKSKFAYLKMSGSGSAGLGSTEAITLLDENFEKIWTKRMITLNSYKECSVENFVVEGNQLIMSLASLKGSMMGALRTAYKIVSLDLLTGETIFTYDLEKIEGKIMHNFSIEVTADQINVMGTYADYKPMERYGLKGQKGLFKVALDMQGKEILKSYSPWSDMTKYVTINAKGQMDKKFGIKVLGTMSLADGTTAFIAEKTIPQRISFGKSLLFGGASFTKKKATDLLCFLFDENFNVMSVKTIIKQKTKGRYSDYLFAQYSEDKSIGHFFFQDLREAETKKGKDQWILGINSIQNGELSTEEVPLTSDDHAIVPLRAKEGYILLREFNEKEKFNQLRLERLNF